MRYINDSGVIYNMDCIAGMGKLKRESIDIAVTSPPYFVGLAGSDVFDGYAEYKSFIQKMYQGVYRLLKPGGYFVVNFGDMHNSKNRIYAAEVPSRFPAQVLHWVSGYSPIQFLFDLQSTRIWRKRFASMGIPFFLRKRPSHVFDYEYVWTWRKWGNEGAEKTLDVKLSQRGVIGEDWKSKAGKDKHPAAFPVELPLWALNSYCNEGIVLDPCMGSGTTAVAAMRLGMRFIGFEIDEENFNYAKDRLDDEEEMLK